ncbi:hypothetical protein NUW58_g4784 [Xylaria curta]|uniref:Uncharacterized protein n=1 Tax=Xylaria curta TaxID=42375 RepID=A0ACC1P659_9PEZI|nr:hypothetical protein NUW58_g4784 [Xylaria curta]
MAILEDVPGIEVAVQIAGNDAVEYDANDNDIVNATCPTVTKYVECVDDAEFAIRIATKRDYAWGYKNHRVSYGVYIDGQPVASKNFSHPSQKTVDSKVAFCSQSQQWNGYKLRFSAISTTDDDSKERVARDLALAKHLGEIRVSVKRCTISGRCDSNARRGQRHHTRKFELAEKSMKGEVISHGTAFSPPEKLQSQDRVLTKMLPEDNGPIAVFRFLYRSRDALQKSLIIPRDASPSSVESFSKLSPADKERLAKGKEVKAEAEALLGRKRAKTENLTGSDKGPKRAKGPVQIIDLTID